MPKRRLVMAFEPNVPNPVPSALISQVRSPVMQRSSASIAALATALAKAQIKLANPEKSLIGTIERQGGEGAARHFRYAPLSSGLEIVRKTLGQHEIATVQTTAIDQAAGIVNLTAKLAAIPAVNEKTGAANPRADPRLVEKTSTPQIDKSMLVFPETRRIRDREHVRHVMKQPCLICGRRPSDAHHLRFAQSRALGRRVGDEFTVPLCRMHHREVHRCGDEEAWWQNAGIGPLAAARTLWLETHPLAREEATTANNEA